MQAILDEIVQSLSNYIPSLVVAFGILVVGWLVALIIAALVRAALHRTAVDNRVAAWIVGEEAVRGINVERWLARLVFWILMLFVLVAFFQRLGATAVVGPLNQVIVQLSQYAPRLVGAAILLAIAWLVAMVLRLVVTRVLGAAKVDERIAGQAGLEGAPEARLARTVGDIVYWIVFLLFLPAFLGVLNLQGLLDPVQGVTSRLLGFVPNLVAAGLILGVGWLVARVVQRIVVSVLAAVGADILADRLKLPVGAQRLSGVVGMVVYVLILIPVFVAALNALALEPVTRPATDMLGAILRALPAIFAAALLLAIAYIVGRVVAGFVSTILGNAGFDALLARLGLARAVGKGELTGSQIAGYLVLVGVMLFASIEAARLLGFEVLAGLIAQFTVAAGKVLTGLVIFGLGLYLAGLAARVIQASRVSYAALLAVVAQVAIVVVAAAMGLRQMNLATEIVNLTFGLILGAIAAALALAFGLGAREAAGREVDHWLQAFRKKP